MSQSPVTEGTDDPGSQYLDAWGQLAKRIQHGQSFSGRERNCCFLNTHQSRFADVSFAVGLDGIDDSRAIAVVDWDQDGDLDLWQANRTGPRLRFLRNDLPVENHWLALRLEGDPRLGCPADAIGARITLRLNAADNRSVDRIQTLTAGDGFLSQSSKWIHFGIPKGATIERVTVRWPGSAQPESWTDLQTNARYGLQQGQRKARLLDDASRTVSGLVSEDRLPAADRPAAADDSGAATARLWLSRPVRIPTDDYVGLPDGRTRSMNSRHHRLVCLWASWCQPCLAELNELNARLDELQAKDTVVMALSVEAMDEDPEAGKQNAKQLVQEAGLQLDMGLAQPEWVQHLNQLRTELIYRQESLPLPSSFLIDAEGRLRAIYAGPLDVDQVLKDIDQLKIVDYESLRSLAVPFAGRWATRRFATHPIAVANVFRQENQIADAVAYLERYLESQRDPMGANGAAGSEAARRRFADVYRLLGELAVDTGDDTLGAQHFERSLKYYPGELKALTQLAELHSRHGRWQASLEAWKRAYRIAPRSPRITNKIGVVHLRLNQIDKAVTYFRQALAIRRNYFAAANNLAWLRATHADPQYRDGKEAVELAKRAVRSARRRYDTLDTLAAALAEAEDFDGAVEVATQAVRRAEEEEADEEVVNRIRRRRELYRQGTPYRAP